MKGDWQKALEIYRKSLALYEKLDDNYWPCTSNWVKNNWGITNRKHTEKIRVFIHEIHKFKNTQVGQAYLVIKKHLKKNYKLRLACFPLTKTTIVIPAMIIKREILNNRF